MVLCQEEPFKINKIERIDKTTIEIYWEISHKFNITSLSGFDLLFQGDSVSKIKKHFPPNMRMAVVKDISEKYYNITALASFLDHPPLIYHKDLFRKCLALQISNNDIQCCNDVLCHDSSRIIPPEFQDLLAICYGDSFVDFFVISNTQLLWLQAEKLIQKFNFPIIKPIVRMSYDWLNKYLTIVTKQKLYQLDVHRQVIFQIDVTEKSFFLDAAVDPINGYIHLLIENDTSHYYVTVPSIISQNTTLSKEVISSYRLLNPYSILIDSNYTSIKILSFQNLTTYIFKTSSWISEDISLNTSAKLLQYSKGFIIWRNTSIYQLEKHNTLHKYSLNSLEFTEEDLEDYIIWNDRYQPVPESSMEITNSFFGDDFISVSWDQPVDKWKSVTSWKLYEYIILLQQKNGSTIQNQIINKTNIQYQNLNKTTNYKVSINIGKYFRTISGQTSVSRIDKFLSYFVVEKGIVRGYNISLITFQISKMENFITGHKLAKDIRVFHNCGFILLQNGSIIKINLNSSKLLLTEIIAEQFDVDYKTGNIFVIGRNSSLVYRYRPVTNNNYIVEGIVKYSTDNMAIIPEENILAIRNKTGNSFFDLNGFSISGSRNITTGYFNNINDDHSIMVFTVETKKFFYSFFQDMSRRLSSIFGLLIWSNNRVLLRNLQNNSSVKLVNNTHNISTVNLLNNVGYKVILLSPVNYESIFITRSKIGEIFLSWQSERNTSNIKFLVIIRNIKRETNYQFFPSQSQVNIKRIGICNESLTIKVRPYLTSTFGDVVEKNLSIPCTTASPKFDNFFINKKQFQKPFQSRLEIRAEFDTKIFTEKIDGKYNCYFNIFFSYNKFPLANNKIIEKKSFSCLDNILLFSLNINENERFKWKEICGELFFGNFSMVKCVKNVLESTEKKIILPKSQAMVFSCINEEIKSLFVTSDKKSIMINKMKNQSRIILKTLYPIEKIEMDWPKNVLFWSEIINEKLDIFSVEMDRNKKNLEEDKIQWFETNITDIKWTTDSITRRLIILLKEKEVSFNLDNQVGMSEDHNILQICSNFINNNSTMKCSSNNNEIINTTYYYSERNIIYQTKMEPSCKILKIRSNYEIPQTTDKCIIKDSSLSIQNRSIFVLRNKNNITIIDEDGYVYESEPFKQNITISVGKTNIFINISCGRNKGLIIINSQQFNTNLHVNICYDNNTVVQLLRNNLLDKKYHKIVLVGLKPNQFYSFTFTIYSLLTNITLTRYARCTTISDVPDSPHNATITILNKNYIKVSWTAGSPNGHEIIYYKLFIRVSKSHSEVNYSNTSMVIIKMSDRNLMISIIAKNKIGSSLPCNVYMEEARMMQSNVITSNHSTMSYSTSILLIIILSLVGLALIISIYVHNFKAKPNPNRSFVIEDARQHLELKNPCQNIKYDVNCLYDLESLPLSNFDRIPHVLNECLTYSHMIGNGAFGMVFKGTMKIETDNNKSFNKSVALKIRNGKSISEDDFKREAILLFKYLHPNIIELYGVSFDCPDKQCLILEYMEKGNLKQYLQHHRPDVIKRRINNNNSRKKMISENSILDVKDRINIASDVLEALKFLETKRFVHRDIAARNCLVSYQNKKQRITKLGDFGLARDIYSDESYRKVSETKLPVRWMAPETIKDGIFTGKSDVWSFGVLCWEIMTFGADPYMGQANSEVIKDVIAGKHLERPDNCPIEFYEIMEQCWKYYSECRPTFSELDILFQYLEEMKDIEDVSTLNRLILRSYNSRDESEYGRNSDPITEKTSLTVSDKYADIATIPTKPENISVKSNYDNLGYEIPRSPLSLVYNEVSLTNEMSDSSTNNINIGYAFNVLYSNN